MEIFFHKRLPSTQLYLKEMLEKGELEPPVMVVADLQDGGVGSRGNRWIGGSGDLFLSFALAKSALPEDLPTASASIYFGYLMKELLAETCPELWLKWPNDLYVGHKKAGGVITHLCGETFICGIGVNLGPREDGYGWVYPAPERKTLLERYISQLKTRQAWKQIFSRYRVEFDLSRVHKAHLDGEKKALENAVLNSDGSITIDGKKVYSLR